MLFSHKPANSTTNATAGLPAVVKANDPTLPYGSTVNVPGSGITTDASNHSLAIAPTVTTTMTSKTIDGPVKVIGPISVNDPTLPTGNTLVPAAKTDT